MKINANHTGNPSAQAPDPILDGPLPQGTHSLGARGEQAARNRRGPFPTHKNPIVLANDGHKIMVDFLPPVVKLKGIILSPDFLKDKQIFDVGGDS
uniref:Uncharacterized protein n=1 Tax=Globodera rostochiensis TaxID=31243 RepID=A0A914I2C1_GLORO